MRQNDLNSAFDSSATQIWADGPAEDHIIWLSAAKD